MKANELRVGSWYMNSEEEFEMDKLALQNHLDRDDDLMDIRPIPLTGEWLVKFGFEKKGFFTYDKKLLSISMPSEDPLLWRKGRTYFNSWKILDAPKYVHQLQNIYFALTGEELTINN